MTRATPCSTAVEGHVGDARVVAPRQLRLRGPGLGARRRPQGLDARRRHGVTASSKADRRRRPCPSAKRGIGRSSTRRTSSAPSTKKKLRTPSNRRVSTAPNRRATGDPGILSAIVPYTALPRRLRLFLPEAELDAPWPRPETSRCWPTEARASARRSSCLPPCCSAATRPRSRSSTRA